MAWDLGVSNQHSSMLDKLRRILPATAHIGEGYVHSHRRVRYLISCYYRPATASFSAGASES